VGEAEEWYFEQLAPGDTFLFGGTVWRFEGIRGMDAFVSHSNDPDPKIPSWGGSKFALSTYLAKRVRTMIEDEPGWGRLPADVQEWFAAQKKRSAIPLEGEMLVETFPRGKRGYIVCYPFEGRLAHTTLAMLLTRRLDRSGCGAAGLHLQRLCAGHSGVCGKPTQSTWTTCSSRTCWATTSKPGSRKAS
jgi:ATP-dependent Lhr-like helicase